MKMIERFNGIISDEGFYENKMSDERIKKIQSLLYSAGFEKLSENVGRYLGLDEEQITPEKIFGVPDAVLRACNDGEDDMLVYPEDRQLLKKAYRKCAEIFEQPLTTVSIMWIRRYYNNLYNVFSNVHMELGKTIRYLNEQVELQEEKNPFVIFVTYYNYLIYLNRVRAYENLYPENIITAEKELAAWIDNRVEKMREEEFIKVVNEPAYRYYEECEAAYPYYMAVPETLNDLRECKHKMKSEVLRRYGTPIKDREVQVYLLKDREGDVVNAYQICGRRLESLLWFSGGETPEEVKLYLKGYAERKNLLYGY